MAKFYLFAGEDYGHKGGANDYIATFEGHINTAINDAYLYMVNSKNKFDWWHIVDENMIIIKSWDL